MRRLLDHRTLSAQIILSVIGLILATIVAVGTPTLWLIQRALDRQAWARMEQAASATEALYAAHMREVEMLTTLTAERPTLQRLLQDQPRGELTAYLETIRTTTRVDLLAVFDPYGVLLAHGMLPDGWDDGIPTALYPQRELPGVRLVEIGAGGVSGIAIQSSVGVYTPDGVHVGSVVEVVLLDDSFLTALQQETGLHHSLFQNGVRVATTLGTLPGTLAPPEQSLVQAGGEPFYTQVLPLTSQAGQVVDILALPASGILTTQTRLIQLFLSVTLVVGAGAALLGSVLAHRISAPLHHLVVMSEGIGRGDLATPINSWSSITEVVMLAHTLDQMRVRLQSAYDDLRRSHAWAENLIASLAEGVLTVDAKSRMTSFSPRAEQMLGWRAGDVIGRPSNTIFSELPPPGQVTKQTVTTREGENRTMLVTSGAITTSPHGQVERALVFRDVTEEEEALRLREFFLANVSHEFKTPLAAVRAAIELLQSDGVAMSPAEQEELLNSIWLGTLRLEELVGNLLSSASIQTGQFEVHPRPINLQAALEEVLLATRPLLALQHQHLWLDIPEQLPLVHADLRRLNQVFVNLISNASKYGPPHSAISIKVELEPNAVRVAFHNDGPGITTEMRPRLFQPFKRGDHHGHGSVGLGLSIVKSIVERHGGEVGVESPTGAGVGATFWFTIPHL